MGDIARIIAGSRNHDDWEKAIKKESAKLRFSEKDGNRIHDLHNKDILTLWPGVVDGPSNAAIKYYLWILQRTSKSNQQWNKVMTLFLDEPEFLPKPGVFDVDNYDVLFFPFITESKPSPEGGKLRPAFTFIALFTKVMFTNGELFAVFFDAQSRWTRSHADAVCALYSKFATGCKKQVYPIKFYCWSLPYRAPSVDGKHPVPDQISDGDSIALAMLYSRCIFGNEPPPLSPLELIEDYRFYLVRDLVLNKMVTNDSGETINVPEVCIQANLETFVTDKYAEKEASLQLPYRLECRFPFTRSKTKVQEFNASSHLCLQNMFSSALDSPKTSIIEDMRAHSPVSVRMFKRYLMLLMKESMEFGNKRYSAKVWVDVPEIRMATSTLDIYKMFDYLLFPFEDKERKGYCTLIIADLVTMRSRGFIPLLYYDLLGHFVRDDVSNVVSIIKGDRKNKDLDPKNMKIEQVRSNEIISTDDGDSALYCMFHAHNLLLKLDKEEGGGDPLIFRTGTQDWFRGHMADEIEKNTVMAFTETGQQPIDIITERDKVKGIVMPTINTNIARSPSPLTPPSPVRSTPFASNRSRSPSPNAGRGHSPVPRSGPSPIQSGGELNQNFIKLEQLHRSPSFGSLEQRMLDLLTRNPDQILHTRPTLVNEQLNPSALVTRQIMQMLPGHVLSEALFNWYCGLLQGVAKTKKEWRSTVIFSPETFSAWRAKKDIVETVNSVGPGNPFGLDVATLFPVCENATTWSVLLARTQPSPTGLVVHLLFFDPNGRFSDPVLIDCVSLLRSFYAYRGGDAKTLSIVPRKFELPEECRAPEPQDCAVEILALVRSVITREKIGLPLRLIPAFRIHAIRELLNNDIILLTNEPENKKKEEEETSQ